MEEEKESEIDSELVNQLSQHYSDAYTENPSLLQFLALIFLKFRSNNYGLAVERLGNYLQWRRQIFGNLDDQTLENNEQLQQQIQSYFLTILPTTLANGEGIFYLELKKHNPSLYSTDDTIKTWHYIIMSTLKKNPNYASKGFYITSNLTNISYSNLDIRIPHAIIPAISNCMPIRICQFFIINPPYIAQFILPIIRMLLSTKLSQRLNIITDFSHLQEYFHLPNTSLPQAIGGDITEEMIQNIAQIVLQENLVV